MASGSSSIFRRGVDESESPRLPLPLGEGWGEGLARRQTLPLNPLPSGEGRRTEEYVEGSFNSKANLQTIAGHRRFADDPDWSCVARPALRARRRDENG